MVVAPPMILLSDGATGEGCKTPGMLQEELGLYKRCAYSGQASFCIDPICQFYHLHSSAYRRHSYLSAHTHTHVFIQMPGSLVHLSIACTLGPCTSVCLFLSTCMCSTGLQYWHRKVKEALILYLSEL
jgi:hypothetical protein